MFYEETKKFLKKTADGVWEITSPHVLYLSSDQGKAYSSNKADPAYNSFHDETVQIIDRHKQEILSLLGDRLTLIDLGPEYPDKTLPLIKEFQRQNKSLDYVPVDINADYVKIAEDAARPYAGRVFGIKSLFEECAGQIPAETHPHKLVFIGLTFMNFHPAKAMSMMRSIAGENGSIGFASELITDKNSIDDIKQHYLNESVSDFAMGPLKNLGVDHRDVEFNVQFNQGRVEIGFVFQTSVPDLGIDAGDRVIVGISHRYRLETLKDLLANTGRPSQVWTSDSGKTAFALC